MPIELDNPKRSCGSCTACCKIMGVGDMEPRKPAGTWCQHCKIGQGCGIYPERPKTCRVFECVWLQDTRGLMGEDMRPDRIRVVFQPTDDGCGLVAHCDPAQPLAWRHPKALAVLRACAKAGYYASARAGDRYWIVTSRIEWPVPEKHIIRGPGGKVDVSIPHHIAAAIGVRT